MDSSDGIVWWRVLGPLQVRTDGVWVGLGAPKWRAAAAALLAEPDEVVSTGRLVSELWGDDPPTAARKLVSGYVLRLRRLIGDREGRVLMTQPPGYRLAVARADVDAGRFEELAAEGRRALDDDDAGRAAQLCAEALGLWRGAALADVPRGALVAAEAGRLEELRLETAERRIEAELRCRGGAGLVPELRRLTAAHPVRERFWHQLMRALEGCGRPAEALAAYAQAREAIADQLGADPGPDLRHLHLRLLAGDPPPLAVSSAVSARSAAAAAAQPAVPRQLPGGVRPFVGRAAELRLLSGLLEETACGGGSVLISAIGGTAGVGKTALALRWAHQVAGRFPDGQLYVNLRGYDLEQPMPAADALAGFLRALGVPGPDIPPETDERAARYRSLLAGRRVLVLLDNAAEVEQVRPLLPGTPSCVAVVTSRDALGGLVAREGAQRLDVDLLPLADAVSLLRALIGERAAADPAAAAGLAERCCRLPLALRVAAELAAARPGASVSELVAELADRQRRLDLLEAGADPRTAVRAVFSWSCRHLDPGAARAFRLAGLHPGTDLDPYAAAALTGSTVAEADQVLGQLARAHLMHTTGPGRYGMHDLLRAYAARQTTAQDGPAGQQVALTGLFDHYLHTAAAAMDALYPAERHRRPRVARPETPVPPLADPAAARTWLDTERDNLVAVATYTAACGWLGHTTRLAAILSRYLDSGGHYPEAITIHTCARRAARDAGDRATEAEALSWLGGVDWRQGHYSQATGQLQQALALFCEIGDRTGEAGALGNLGIIDFQQGRYSQAAGHHQQALALFCEIGDRTGEARALANLGEVELRQGRYPQAASHHRQALALCRETGNRTGEARTLNNLGDVELRQGRYPQAASHHRQALALCREFGDRLGEAHVLASLGIADWRQDRHPQAVDHLREALALFRETGDRAGEADVLNTLGEVLLAAGQPGHARRQWEQALTLYVSLGTPEANDVRAQLGIVNTTAQIPARTKS